MEYIDFEWWPSCPPPPPPPPPPPCLLRPPPPRSPPPGLLRFDLLDPPDFEGGAGAWGRFGIVVVMLVEGDLEVVEAAVTTEAQSTDVAEEDMDEVAVEGEPPLAAS